METHRKMKFHLTHNVQNSPMFDLAVASHTNGRMKDFSLLKKCVVLHRFAEVLGFFLHFL